MRFLCVVQSEALELALDQLGIVGGRWIHRLAYMRPAVGRAATVVAVR